MLQKKPGSKVLQIPGRGPRTRSPPQVARPLTFRIQHFGNVQVLLRNLHGQVDISHWVVLQEKRHVQMFKGVFLDI